MNMSVIHTNDVGMDSDLACLMSVDKSACSYDQMITIQWI